MKKIFSLFLIGALVAGTASAFDHDNHNCKKKCPEKSGQKGACCAGHAEGASANGNGKACCQGGDKSKCHHEEGANKEHQEKHEEKQSK